MQRHSDLVKTLDIIIRTCRCYDMSSAPEAKKHVRKQERWKVVEMERNQMQLGYTPRWELPPHVVVVLGNEMRTSKDEAIRKAAYEA
jgi:hypothetical protein